MKHEIKVVNVERISITLIDHIFWNLGVGLVLELDSKLDSFIQQVPNTVRIQNRICYLFTFLISKSD